MESRQVGVTLEWLHPKARGALQRYLNLPSPLSFPIVYRFETVDIFKSPLFFENVCPLYFVHRQHPQKISLLHLHLLPFLVAESTGMNNSVLDLLYGLLLSSSESCISQIMSLHFSCSHKCHCLIGFLWEQHISTTCTAWLFSSFLPSQPLNPYVSYVSILLLPLCPWIQRSSDSSFCSLTFLPHHPPEWLTFKTSPLWKWYPPSLLLPSFYFQKKSHRYLEFRIYKTSVHSSQTYLSLCILSWLKMLAITLAGKLWVYFYIHFLLTRYNPQVADSVFSSKSLFLSISSFHCQCLSLNLHHLSFALFLF